MQNNDIGRLDWLQEYQTLLARGLQLNTDAMYQLQEDVLPADLLQTWLVAQSDVFCF